MVSLFTKIVDGELPCHKVYEDDDHLAFLDLRPISAGHTLLIPKKEIDYLFDMPDEDYVRMWSVAKKIAAHLQSQTGCARVCVGVWGFEVPHAHIHLVPTDSMADFPPPPDRMNPSSDDLARVAKNLAF